MNAVAAVLIACPVLLAACDPPPVKTVLHAPLVYRLDRYRWQAEAEGNEELHGQLTAQRDALASRYAAAFDRLVLAKNPVPLSDSRDAVDNLVGHLAALHKSEISPRQLLRWAASHPRNEAAFLAMSGFRHAGLDEGFLNWMDAVAEHCTDMSEGDFAVFARITRALDGYYAEAARVAWFDAFTRCSAAICQAMESDACVAWEVEGAFEYELYGVWSEEALFARIPPESHACVRGIIRTIGIHRPDP